MPLALDREKPPAQNAEHSISRRASFALASQSAKYSTARIGRSTPRFRYFRWRTVHRREPKLYGRECVTRLASLSRRYGIPDCQWQPPRHLLKSVPVSGKAPGRVLRPARQIVSRLFTCVKGKLD